MKEVYESREYSRKCSGMFPKGISALIIILLFVTSGLFAGTALQQIVVTGTVTDASTGVSLPGVNIIIQGTTTGAITDMDGKYSIEVPGPEAVLMYSFVGYHTVELPVGDRRSIDVVLTPATEMLDELIVIGYGVQRRSDLTGSVTRVSMDDMAARTDVNISQALSGAAAGVNVSRSGGAGSEPSVEIRGRTSLSASATPLIVLDGIIYNGRIGDININNVASIDILKDASAAAVYGSRSANGVILISTKRGQTDKPVISFNGYAGYQDMTNNPMRVMNGDEFVRRLTDYYYQQDLYSWYATNPTSSAGKPATPDYSPQNMAPRLRSTEERENYLAGIETDWVDQTLQIGRLQNYSLSASGQADRINYFVSGGYTNEEGIRINDNFDRYTLHANLNTDITDWLSVELITSYSHMDYSGEPSNLGHARNASPWATNRIGEPEWDMHLTGEVYMQMPLNNLQIISDNKRDNLFMVGSTTIDIPWIEGLSYEFNYSNTFINGHNNRFWPNTIPGGAANNGQARKEPWQQRNWIFNNIVTYRRNFGDHQVHSTLLYSREHRNNQWSYLNAQGFDNPTLGYNRMSLGTIVDINSSAWEENSLSYMGRINYTYLSRYLLTATIRQDGFSGFGPENKWAIFPSVSLGWVTSDEDFFNVDGLYLKLRTSYGQTGNQGIGRYSSFSRMGTTAYVFGSQTAVGVFPNTLGNAGLGWETTTSFNVGADFGILNQRIAGSIDLYQAETTDVLVERALPSMTGYGSVWTNIGGIDNKGIELELRTLNLDGVLRWESQFVFSLNRDKITKLYGEDDDRDIGNSWFVGEPISAIYDYEMAGGVWTEEELYSGNIYPGWYPGQFRYVDHTGSNSIQPEDRTIVGYTTPSHRFSLNNALSYRNFRLSFFINAVQGGSNYYLANNQSVLNVDWRSDNVLRINASAVRPYWTPENGVDNATGVYNSPPVSSGIYQSRSFVRLQDVSLSYNFSSEMLNSINVDAFQIYIASKNTYTWTNWSGWDPETGTSNTPLMRNITAGFRVSF